MNRIQALVKDKLFQKYLQKNKKHEENRPFCVHNLKHLLSAARIAYIIALERGLDFSKEIIYAAGLVHDIGRWKEYETGQDHAEVSAKLALEILERCGFNRGEIKIILTAVKEHRGKKKNRSSSLLGEILHEADMLSRCCWQCSARDRCYKYQIMPARDGPVS